MYWDTEKTTELLDHATSSVEADDVEIYFQAHDYGLSRFAGNVIHQNMNEEDGILSIRVAVGNKLGSCTTNQLDKDGIKKAAKQAVEIAKFSNEYPNFPGFAKPMSIPPISNVFIEETHNCNPQKRSDMAKAMISNVKNKGFEAAGAVSTGTYTTAVATGQGHKTCQVETRNHALTVVNRPGQAGFGTGYSEWYGRDIQDFSPQKVSDEAIAVSSTNTNPASISPGTYTVILTPYAVGLLLYYLSWMGCHARAIQNKQSFMYNKQNQQVLDDKISIWDDGLNPSGFAIPFDPEGYPKKRVEIIADGLAKDVVYDSFTAITAGKQNTGHALSPLRDRYYSSPLPQNLFMKAGESSLEEMISSTENGILINHLWYVREVHFGKTIVTGMTRDGTFLVKNGKISRALHNLRFSQSIFKAFQKVEMVGKDLHLAEQFIGSSLVPALKLTNFNIVGTSPF